MTCGPTSHNANLANSFVLDFPSSVLAPSLYEPRTAWATMEVVVSAMDPDWATLTSHGLVDALDPSPRHPIPGWITFLSGHRHVPDAISAHRTEPVAGGTMLLATRSPEATTPDVLVRLEARLAAVGSLEPTR